MSAGNGKVQTADIVDMAGYLNRPTRKRIATTAENRDNASLLSIRNSLAYQATLGIDDLDVLADHLTRQQLDHLDASVRCLLDTEFGHLRVHRHRRAFAVGHHCLDSLIAGLLRVQFHSREIDLPANLPVVDPASVDGSSTLVSWGVGGSLAEADNERRRRRRLTQS